MSDVLDFLDDDDDDATETAKAVASFDFGPEDDGMDYFGEVKPLKKHAWMATKKFVLVTPANITECIDACINGLKGRFALDLETTGLDNRVDPVSGATKDKIVGVCLSGDGVTGWYIPLRHQKGAQHNVPFRIFDPEFRRLMAAVDEGRVVAIFHNGKFDQEFLEYNGGEPYGNWDVPKHWDDTLILAYLRHSRARRKTLKILSAAPAEENPTPEQISQVGGRGLGMVMYELEDLFPPPKKGEARKYDYSLLDPSEDGPLIYGCSDGICTWLLADMLIPEVLQPKHVWNQKVIYTIEKLCVTATRWMERSRILTDPAKVMELIKLGQQEWFDSVMDVYAAASEILKRDVMPGYYKVLLHGDPDDPRGARKFVADDPLCLLPQQVLFAKSREATWYRNPIGKAETRGKHWPIIYDVNAPQQLGEMFEEMAVPGLKYTEKSGQVMTKKEELERVIDEAEDRFPFMSKIKRFRETNKALSSYLYPMLEDVDPSDHTMRINFVAHKVDTGRFSTPAKERELGVKNTKIMKGWPEINLQSMPATYDPKRPASMTRLRECIVARPGHYIVAIDFSGEELRLVTNLSGEPKWLDEFFHCSQCNRKFNRGDGATTPTPPPARCPNCGSDKIGDLHTLTALSIYGQEAPRKDNWKALRGYAKAVNFALCYGGGGNAVVRSTGVDKNEGWRIKNSFDSTYLGLKRWWGGQHRFAHDYGFVATAFGRIYPVPDIWSADGGFRSKAERNSVNGPIQGSGADIIKIAMGLAYNVCKKKGWFNQVRLVATMHDELVFEVHGSILEEAINTLTPAMTSNALVMGMKWPVPLTTDCEVGQDWTVNWALNEMRYREIRFDGDKKVKAPKKPQKDDDKYKDSPEAFRKALEEYPAKKAAWEAMPHSWPECLRSRFTNLGPVEGGVSVSPPTTSPQASVPAPLPPSAEVTPQEVQEPMSSPVAEAPTRQERTMPEEPGTPTAAPAGLADFDEDEIPGATVTETGLTTAPASEPAPSTAELPQAAPPVQQPPRMMKSGDTYDFVLGVPLTPGSCADLSQVITACQAGGTKKLRLVLPDGTVLTGWSDTDCFVTPDQFYWKAKDAGLAG